MYATVYQFTRHPIQEDLNFEGGRYYYYSFMWDIINNIYILYYLFVQKIGSLNVLFQWHIGCECVCLIITYH